MKYLLRVLLAASACTVFAVPAQGAGVELAPSLPGSFGTGGGSDARFVKIDDNWQGSTVLWDEATQTYGIGEPISSFAWGTGLWGLADLNALIGTPAGQSPVLATWSGIAGTINFGNTLYNDLHSAQWGPTSAMPLAELQTNWLAKFDGYIRITEKTLYNFSVLYDDGFVFTLYGAGGATLSLSKDGVNPRDRLGFDEDILLDVGLYRFELAAYNRLEAGVVDLRWSREGAADWTLVPTENLISLTQPLPVPVPEPATWWMLLGGLGLVLAARRPRS